MPWRRATRLSKARHDTHLHLGITKELHLKLNSVDVEKNKHGIFHKIWIRILYTGYLYRAHFHVAVYMPYSERLTYRLVYCFTYLCSYRSSSGTGSHHPTKDCWAKLQKV
jgi:hypothetical protein